MTPLGVLWKLKVIHLAYTLPKSVRKHQNKQVRPASKWWGQPGYGRMLTGSQGRATRWTQSYSMVSCLSGRERVFSLGMHPFYPSSQNPKKSKSIPKLLDARFSPVHLHRPAAGRACSTHSSAGLHTLCSWVTYVHIRSELDKKALPFEAQLPYLGPVKSIDFRETLRKESNPWADPGHAQEAHGNPRQRVEGQVNRAGKAFDGWFPGSVSTGCHPLLHCYFSLIIEFGIQTMSAFM